MLELTILGTSSMVPTKERNQSSLFIALATQGILVDCGEGTQRQLKQAGIPLSKITKILITHFHSDHTLGLPGLLQSMGANEYSGKLELYGPKGSKQRIGHMFEAFLIDRHIDLEIHEISTGMFFENADFILESRKLEHGIECLGYALIEKDKRKINLAKAKKLGVPEGPLMGKLQRGESITHKGTKISPDDISTLVKGKKIAIISDTKLCDGCMELAKHADVLVSEATYHSSMEEKADTYNHMTSAQAATIASNAGAKKLILTHFSARYKSTYELHEDATAIFPNTECAFDFMRIKL